MPKPTKPVPEEGPAAGVPSPPADAAKSPTAEDHARSAQNSRQHGFTASKFAVVRLEELDSLAHLRADAIAAYRPVNSQELFALERIALAQQAMLRCSALEAGLHTAAMNETIAPDGLPANLLSDQLTGDIQVARAQNRSLCLAVGFQRLVGKSDSWKLFLRYQAQTERLYRRAVEEFDRLKALRSEFPNEPIAADLEPDEIAPVDHPRTNPPQPPESSTTSPPDLFFDPTRARTSPFPPSFPPQRRNHRPQRAPDR